ncbi:MAG: hypothetical protein KTR32_33625, partial [Granulosicoccus sp.]|nr:hypothetical protein [Granulosicoccus sp.]
MATISAMPNAEHDADADKAWTQLRAELDAWSSAGKTATFWWRDDDASAPGPKLDKLMDISAPCGLLLAVIPTRLDPSLVTAVKPAPHVYIAQHGYAHINHAPRGLGLGAWELGMHRGIESVMADLTAGRTILTDHFESNVLQVVVPPWNRIAAELIKPIAEHEFCGVSAFGPRGDKHPEPGLTIVNSHCDPIRWKSGPRFRGVTKSISQLLEHLQARRAGSVDATETTGLLT